MSETSEGMVAMCGSTDLREERNWRILSSTLGFFDIRRDVRLRLRIKVAKICGVNL